MNAGIRHILAPEELTQRSTCTPEHHLIIIYTIELQGFQDTLMVVMTIHVALADEFAQFISRVDRTLVHIHLNTVPVALMNQFS